MSKAINTLREHFNQRPVPNSKVLMEERDRVNAMIDAVEAENARLRELADAVKEFVEDAYCEDCPCRHDCDDNNRIFCADDISYHAFAAMREFGIEVN